MTRTRIKICGITRVDDALAAQGEGVDALGLIFYARSPRAVTPDMAANLAGAIDPLTTLVGLFVNPDPTEVRNAITAAGLQLLQFHGDENAAFCSQFDRPWIKAIRVRNSAQLAQAAGDFGSARGLLLDAYVDGREGGTGTSFDWNCIPPLRQPYLLAGGLHAANVGAAIASCHPYGVDVSSGVESAPGIKDAAKMRAFIQAVERADQAAREKS